MIFEKPDMNLKCAAKMNCVLINYLRTFKMVKEIKHDYFEKEINFCKDEFIEYIGLKHGEKLGSFHLEKKAELWKNTYKYSVKPGNKTAPKICTLLCKLYEDVRRGDVDFDIIENEFIIIMGMAKKMAAKLKEYNEKN